MPRNTRVELTPEEELAKHISAMHDSVTLINSIVSGDASDEETLDRVYRNYRHLEIMLARPEIAESNEDLSAFNAAITAGTAYINEKDPTFLTEGQ